MNITAKFCSPIVTAYRQTLRQQKTLGIKNKVFVLGDSTRILLKSETGNKIGEIELCLGYTSYQIHKVVVSEHNLSRGYGRLLQMHAAFHAISQKAPLKFPSFSYTQEGHIAFAHYPCLASSIIKYTLATMITETKPPIDLPFSLPPVNIGEAYTNRSLTELFLFRN
ncbi:MAG: hypothetical protein P0S95_02495 [Rhabdochlamydiaceae bacterium]|nr:hypothetical protein [Candidatus Amphrikana amoebophyrae]